MSSTLDPITRRHVEKATESLVGEFAGIFAPETIDRYIVDSLDQLGTARFSDFLPVLAYRFARERLKALGQLHHLSPQCKAIQSGRSQQRNARPQRSGP